MSRSVQKRKGHEEPTGSLEILPNEFSTEKRKQDTRHHSAIPSDLLSEPTLADRLAQVEVSAEAEDKATMEEEEVPKADSLALLLEQGLTSQDSSILRSVLSRTEESLIRKSLELLPVGLTVSLVEYLGKMCAEERPRANRAPLVWLSLVLTIRAAYLSTLPNLGELLRNVRSHSDARSRNLQRYLQLAGVISTAINLVKQRQYKNSPVSVEERKQSSVLVYTENVEDGTDSEEEDEDGELSDEKSSDELTDDSMEVTTQLGNGLKNGQLSEEEEDEDDLEEPPMKVDRKHSSSGKKAHH